MAIYTLPLKTHLLTRLTGHYSINRKKHHATQAATSALTSSRPGPTLVEYESVGELGSFIKQCMLSADSTVYGPASRR